MDTIPAQPEKTGGIMTIPSTEYVEASHAQESLSGGEPTALRQGLKGISRTVNDPRKWIQIYDHLRNQIVSGTLKNFDHCPPIGYTAQEWGVARQTAAKAYRKLAQDGYLRLFPGSAGYIVSWKGETQ